MSKRTSIILATTVMVLLPCSAFAHNPVLYGLIELSLVFSALGLALAAKIQLVPIFTKPGQPPSARAYFGVAGLELFFMCLALVIAESLSPTTVRVSELNFSFPVYLILAFFPNLYLVKTRKARIAKAFVLELIFPVLVGLAYYARLAWWLYSNIS